MFNELRHSVAAVASRPRFRHLLLWLAGILVVYALIGFFVLPPFVRPVLERSLSAELQRNVTIEELRINPFTLSTTARGITIGERGAGPPMLQLAELYVNAGIASLFRWAPVINELKLTQPSLHLVRNEDKSYNVSDLVDQALAGPPGAPPRFSASNIEVLDGRIDFDDHPTGEQHHVTELNLGIPFLSSLPSQADIKVAPAFSARINGKAVAVTGETQPFEETHQTVLHWHLADLPLPPYLDYLPFKLPAKVESGRLDASLDLTFVGRGRQPAQLALAGDLELANLVVNEYSGASLLRLPSLIIAIDRFDLTAGSAELRTIAAERPEIDLRRESGGKWNVAAFASNDARPANHSAPFQFHIANIALTHGVVRVADATVKPTFAATLNDVAIEIKDLATTADHKGEMSLSFDTDAGEHIKHHGTLGLSPVKADGRLEIAGLRLGRLYPYYASALNLVADEGVLDASTDFQYGADTGLALANLGATVRNLNMRLPEEKEPLWRVPVLVGQGGTVDVVKQVVSFDSLESHGAVANIRRNAEGTWNFARVIRTPAGGARAAAGGEGLRFDARKITIDDSTATLVDESVTPPAHISLTRIAVDAENFSNAAKLKGHATLRATINKNGTLSFSGPVATAPFTATFDAVAKNVDLVPFQGYVTQAVRMVLTGGAVSVNGSLDIASSVAMQAGFKGNIVLTDIAALDEANETDLLRWKTLSLTGIDAQLEPRAVTIGDIALDDFFARLILNASGEFNLQQLARGRSSAAAPATSTDGGKTVDLATAPGTATTWLKLGKASLSGGNVYFTDHFIRPNYSADLTGLTGSLSTLAFDHPADMELRGRVQQSAPVEIVGRINPLAQNLFLDVKAEASDIELPPLSPYSDKYIGYGIEKGKLSMKVRYLIDNRKLTAENTVILDQLTFGNKVESPDAIKVPVLLAVALLKDRNGVIRFDLPVSGSLDDPQFSVGGIVFRALVNLLGKVVTAPFALLGALGGHGEDLAYIEFASGSAVLDEPSKDKIKAVAKSLADRPALKLDVAGRVDPAADRDGLKRSALDRQIRQQKFNDLAKGGEPPSSVDSVEVPAGERDALLTRVYKDAKIDKPRNAIGLPKDLPPAEMEALLLANIAVSDEDMRALAERRAQTVQASLVDTEKVPGERVFLVEPHLNAEGIKDKGKATRVDFALH